MPNGDCTALVDKGRKLIDCTVVYYFQMFIDMVILYGFDPLFGPTITQGRFLTVRVNFRPLSTNAVQSLFGIYCQKGQHGHDNEIQCEPFLHKNIETYSAYHCFMTYG